MILGLMLAGVIGWRGVFYLTGSLGVLVAFIIYFGVKEPIRGESEPELAEFENLSPYRLEWKNVVRLFKIPTLRLLFIQGFFGVFPWNAITYWFFTYLETERDYTSQEVLVTMVIAVVILAVGYPLGGALGDMLFARTKRGRIIIAEIGVVLGAIFLSITLNIPIGSQLVFIIFLSLTAIFMPFPSANVLSTVHDITLPKCA
jgi:predicted MFS family arabinose efflux permease